MRNKKWLRYGLASTVMTIGAVGAVLVACGDDDSGVTANQPDGSTPDTGGGGDTGTPDTGKPDTGTDSSTPEPAKIIVVHAATDYGPGNPNGMVRVCYATKTASDPDFVVSPLAPLPHSVEDGGALPIPGIPIGTGGPFPSTGLPLEGISIRPYVISAAALAGRGIVGTTGAAATARCNRLLQPGFVPDAGFANDAGALVENDDFWRLADIPAGTFKNGKTYILGIYGCTQDVDGTNGAGFGGKCGPNLDGTGAFAPDGGKGPGNLKIVVLELDATTTVAATEMGIQVANLSPQVELYKTQVGLAPFAPVVANGDDAGPDAATKKFISPDGGEQEIPFVANPTAATPMVKVTGIVSNQGYFAANDTRNSIPLEMFVPLPMNNSVGKQPSIQILTQGKANATELYVNGKSYTFVLVGDPLPPAGSTTGAGQTRTVHFLGFPNVFTPPPAN